MPTDCNCINNTDPTWEPESQAIFLALSEGKFPLNKKVKDALDAIVKLAKSGNAPAPAIVVTANSTTISDDALVNRTVAMIVVEDVPKTTGFTKSGLTDEAKLLSDTLIITDGTVINGSTNVVIIFK